MQCIVTIYFQKIGGDYRTHVN